MIVVEVRFKVYYFLEGFNFIVIDFRFREVVIRHMYIFTFYFDIT
jgi:hypothetical protein